MEETDKQELTLVEGAEQQGSPASREMVEHPAKLLRIGGMLRESLEEVRRASLDEEGRRRASESHRLAIEELKQALSADLKEELGRVTIPFHGEVPTQSELGIAHAQLVGWLEGVFHGMQAVLFGQQMAAQGQPSPFRRPGPPPPEQPRGPGQYL